MKRREKNYWKSRAEQSQIETRTSRTEGRTTQLVKPRPDPMWTGQKFDKWKDEIATWNKNNRSGNEEKYLDLVESLKKNAGIKEFVSRTLMDKIGDTRTVDRVMEIMSEKYDRNMGEKTLEVMRKISGEGFRSDESVDKMMDRVGEMMVEIEKVKLADNLNYAMGIQFFRKVRKEWTSS